MTCISHVLRQLDMVSYSPLGGNGVPLRGAMLFRLRFVTITAALSIPPVSPNLKRRVIFLEFLLSLFWEGNDLE